MVMYLGRPVEQGKKEIIFAEPVHPYTQALLAATPRVDKEARAKRIRISGELPSPLNPPSGCSFHRRCPHKSDICTTRSPELRKVAGRMVACHHAEDVIGTSS